MNTVDLKAAPREQTGTKSAKELRKDELVPCIIYGGKNNIMFSIHKNELNQIIYTGDFFKVAVEVDGKTYDTIVKDIQFHPVTDEVMHMDFQELVKGRKVKTSIPVHLEGKPVGVAEGGILQHKLLRLNVRVKPENMIEYLSIDVSELGLGSSVKVESIDSGAIEVLDSPTIPVASVISPRALRSAQSTAVTEEGEEGEEGEAVEGEEGAEATEGAEGAEGEDAEG